MNGEKAIPNIQIMFMKYFHTERVMELIFQLLHKNSRTLVLRHHWESCWILGLFASLQSFPMDWCLNWKERFCAIRPTAELSIS